VWPVGRVRKICVDRLIASFGVAYPGIFFGRVKKIQLRTESRENGDVGVVAP
jgi:hypothetical protein